MALIQKPEHINKNDIPFFFTDGCYINGELYVPWQQVLSALARTELKNTETSYERSEINEHS